MKMGGSCLKATFIFLLCCALNSRVTDSETSYTWRLDLANGEGKIVADLGLGAANLQAKAEEVARQEVVMDILLSTVTNHEGTWKKTSSENHCSLYGISHCQETYGGHQARNNRGILIEPQDVDDEVLDCGKAVNFTYYDHLVGIQNRASHLHIPEPEVANLFKKKSKKGSEVDIDSIERRLKKSKREKPKSVEIYNQIANFWRIKGDTQASIECFRRALAVSPNNAEILLNLARVLFNLQYLDDAIFLTRRSLEVQPPDQNAWQQHFQVNITEVVPSSLFRNSILSRQYKSEVLYYELAKSITAMDNIHWIWIIRYTGWFIYLAVPIFSTKNKNNVETAGSFFYI